MKKLLLLLPLTFLSVPSIPVQAQQVNNYAVCTQNQEVYQPGGYDQYGNYIPGGVSVQRYNVPCNNVSQSQQYQQERICNPTAGAALGAGLAGALSGGLGYNYNNSWSNNYDRNSSSGSSSGSYRSNDSWALFGAGLGALIFSC